MKIEPVSEEAPRRGPDRRSLTWFLACRVGIITLLLGGGALYYLRGQVGNLAAPLLFLLIGLSYFQALLSALLLRWVQRSSLFAQLQILWDLLFITVLILFTGGLESVFSFVYLLVIVGASFLLTRRSTIFVAGTAAILYGGLLDLQYYGYLSLMDANIHHPAGSYLYSVFVHVVAFLLTAQLSGTLAERLWRSEVALQRKRVDYEELERLNRTILANISSGLMIVSRQGDIRSFNQAATDITGYMLEEVYGRRVVEFFPEFEILVEDGYNLTTRAEGRFEDRRGQELVLGYTTTLVRDLEGRDVGLLVTFQDLTQLKQIEAQLQRADRLVAVGRFASGMAHEIRNPLASISGSVQLLMEGEKVAAEDRHLMGIVVREAERLSGLLTDFLVFARPKPPSLEVTDVTLILDELAAMLEVDPRFDGVRIERRCQRGALFRLDRFQIRQTLWDLALNATEAMEGVGLLVLAVDPQGQCIYVEDSGPGIEESVAAKIFDPFFSTKEKGTGLGLVTVYSIMEAHGGTIKVAPGAQGGTRFSLCFSDEAAKVKRIF